MIFKNTKKIFVNKKRPTEFYSLIEFKTGNIYVGRKVPTINIFFKVNNTEVLTKGALDLREFDQFLKDNGLTRDDKISSMKVEQLNTTALTKFSFKVKQGLISVKYNNEFNEAMSSDLSYKDAKIELFKGKEIDGLDYTNSNFLENVLTEEEEENETED